MILLGLALFSALLSDDFLHSANFAGFKSNLDAVRMICGVGQNVSHDSARALSRALILFLDDFNFQPALYIFPILPIHPVHNDKNAFLRN